MKSKLALAIMTLNLVWTVPDLAAQGRGNGNGNGGGNGGGGGVCEIAQPTPAGATTPVFVSDPGGEDQSQFGRQVVGEYVPSLDAVVFAVTDNHDGQNGGNGGLHLYTLDLSAGTIAALGVSPRALTNGGHLRVANLNGDGIPDFVGARNYDALAELYVSGPGPQWTTTPVLAPPDTSKFGQGLDVGDIDGDGTDEFAVGAEGGGKGKKAKTGKAFVYDLDVTGTPVLVQTIDSGDSTSSFGSAIALGDLSDNGAHITTGLPYLELAVGARRGDSFLSDAGDLFVYNWNGSTFDLVPVATGSGANAGDRLGFEFAAAPVEDSGGDALIAATTWDTVQDRAEVFFHNPPATLVPNRTLVPTGETKGWASRGIHTGDADRDLFADVIIGAPNAGCGNVKSVGTGFMFLGASTSPVAFHPVGLNTNDDWHAFGWGADIVSADTDNDGTPDRSFIFIGEPGREAGGPANVGRVYVYEWVGSPVP